MEGMGKEWTGRLIARIQANPALVSPPSHLQWARRSFTPAGSPSERLRDELKGQLQSMERGGSSSHSPTRFS